MRTPKPAQPARSYTFALMLALAGSATALLAACAAQDSLPALTVIRSEVDDAVVTTQVRSALHSHKDTERFNVKVGTHQGVVQLSGFVYNQAQSDAVLQVARSVKGVKAVANNLTPKVAPGSAA